MKKHWVHVYQTAKAGYVIRQVDKEAYDKISALAGEVTGLHWVVNREVFVVHRRSTKKSFHKSICEGFLF